MSNVRMARGSPSRPCTNDATGFEWSTPVSVPTTSMPVCATSTALAASSRDAAVAASATVSSLGSATAISLAPSPTVYFAGSMSRATASSARGR